MRKRDQTRFGKGGVWRVYPSVLLLGPATETAVVLMAAGDRPVYGMDVFDVLDKRRRLRFQPPAPAKDVDLEAYAGRYSAQPWHSEVAIVQWGMGLAALWLPRTDPAGA